MSPVECKVIGDFAFLAVESPKGNAAIQMAFPEARYVPSHGWRVDAWRKWSELKRVMAAVGHEAVLVTEEWP